MQQNSVNPGLDSEGFFRRMPLMEWDGRKIIHIDMDCFYAAIEMRDHPQLKDKAVAVSGKSSRAVVATANYAARTFGIHSAMPLYKAKERCSTLAVMPPRMAVYKKVSQSIHKIFHRYTPTIQPLSLDEAYLDISHYQDKTGWAIAREIRQDIYRETKLTASAGIAPNKMLAKIASDWKKPNGQFAILPQDVEAFMQSLSIRKIPGIGPVSQEKLSHLDIHSCGDLQRLSAYELEGHFGKWGKELYDRCRGIDPRPVETKRERKSLSNEKTFARDLATEAHAKSKLPALLAELSHDLEKKQGPKFQKIFLKLKFSNFKTTTIESAAQDIQLSDFETLLNKAWKRSPHGVRLIGVGVKFPSKKAPQKDQLLLDFAD